VVAGTNAFDFTVFLLIMKPIADEFHVPLTEVAFVLTVTLWMRLLGAVASGWLADRVGRKIPLMISILWYSAANFAAGFSPTFMFLFICRALLGIGWAQNGQPARRSRWSSGRSARAGS
jgi:SHS family lactate transporter-like MFS transporter